MDKENIIAHFGEAFYAKVLNDLEKYASEWDLSELEQIDYYSVSCIFKCVSNKHGKCVLKIGKSAGVTGNEYRILREYNGSRFCKVYEADVANGILLIERITPGTQLCDGPELDKRLDLFYDLFCGLHIEPADKAVYPTYMGWVARITEYMRSRTDYKILCEKMVAAEEICRRLCEKYSSEMLLHGDLHHDNILFGIDSRYRIIDPKGVIGDRVFDIPRFILNEFDDVHDDNFIKKFTHITRTLAEKLNMPEYDIRCLTHVEMCMANCWNVESADEPNIDCVLFTEKMMATL